MMRLGASRLGFARPSVAMVTNGDNYASWCLPARLCAFGALHLPPMSIISWQRVTAAPTPSTTSKPYAIRATPSKHGMKTESAVVSSSFLRGLKNDHFWSEKGEGGLSCSRRGQFTT